MAQITTALDDIGPMSALELACLTGLVRLTVNKQIRQLRAKGEIHIARYEHQPDGQRGRLIVVYGIGGVEDAPLMPARTVKQRNRKYYQRHAALISARRYPHVRQAAGVWAGLM